MAAQGNDRPPKHPKTLEQKASNGKDSPKLMRDAMPHRDSVRDPKGKRPMVYEQVPYEEDSSDSDSGSEDGDDLLEAMGAFLVSAEGVTVADSFLSIAKSLSNLTVSFEKLLKFSKMQTRELQAISAAVARYEEDDSSEDDARGDIYVPGAPAGGDAGDDAESYIQESTAAVIADASSSEP